MPSQFEKFNQLPTELKIEAAQYLSNPAVLNFSMTSKNHWALFKPMIDVRKLLDHVTHGEHDSVQAMLNQDMRLIFKRGVVTDCSGRKFENISGFEYALWALDKHMWTAMMACIPPDEEGRKVFAQLIDQYNKVNTNGVTYQLNGKTITEKHFDFENTIIKELKAQVDSVNATGVKNWEAIDMQWRKGVGGAQNLFPMHVVDEYCSHDNELFYPVPKCTSQPKSSRQFYHLPTDKNENWFSLDSKLSIDFAIYKGGGRTPSSIEGCAPWRAAMVDLNAMKALCTVRTNDFLNLNSQLKGQMPLDNRHQVPQI